MTKLYPVRFWLICLANYFPTPQESNSWTDDSAYIGEGAEEGWKRWQLYPNIDY